MKNVLILLLICSMILFNGCYTVVSLNEESEELVEPVEKDTQYSGSYFDEDIYEEEEVDYSSDYADINLEEENTEPGFFEILFTEIFIGLSNISYSEDVIIYEQDSDNSVSSNENTTNERDNSSTRNSGNRNYSQRK